MNEPGDPPWEQVLGLFSQGKEQAAYDFLRTTWRFPGMTVGLCGHLKADEGGQVFASIGSQLATLGIEKGWGALKVPDELTGHHVGVVGAGPAGLSATVALLELGHAVSLYEQSDQLGGMPQLVIRAARCPDVEPEIYAVLQAAMDAGRLQLRFGHELGRNLGLNILKASHDAVLLTTGLWQEAALGPRVPGLVDGLTFLGELKRGVRTSVPDRVVILGGGDCAMDVSAAVHALGAGEIRLVYAGAFADMHWHLPDDWFEGHGVGLLDRTKALEVVLGDEGVVNGLRVEGDAGEEVLQADLVIEAMGLQVTAGVRRELGQQNGDGLKSMIRQHDGKVFVAGALVNGGASVSLCAGEGLQVAKEIDRFLA